MFEIVVPSPAHSAEVRRERTWLRVRVHDGSHYLQLAQPLGEDLLLAFFNDRIGHLAVLIAYQITLLIVERRPQDLDQHCLHHRDLVLSIRFGTRRAQHTVVVNRA